MRLRPYISLARPDHWFKNVFIIPGLLLALFFRPGVLTPDRIPWIILAFLSACLTASSNYVINEILDAETDRHHPRKCNRPLASGAARPGPAYVLFIILGILGVGLGYLVNKPFGHSALALWIMGLLYNVRPIRCKDRAYLDVISEAVNNPIRLYMGWFATGLVEAPPPLSVALAYWMFGAFLMAVKRFAEYRVIADAQRAANYRRSFGYYNEERLLESIVFYAGFFAMMSGVFISRYCMALLLATPLVVYAMAYYMHLGFKPNSAVQFPEKLYRQRKLMAIVTFTFLACALLLFVKIPGLERLLEPAILRP